MGNIRIIGGKWKGRKVFVPIISNKKIMVRPTMNQIREVLFNWLEPVISGSVCLDCFSGSGALGLEALSRGAKRVTFVEKNFFCVSSLKKMMQVFQIKNSYAVEIVRADCFRWLRRCRDQYDIVFLDPPFQRYGIFDLIDLLETYKYLKKKSWVYIETSKRWDMDDVFLPKFWSLYRKKNTRTVVFYLYLRNV